MSSKIAVIIPTLNREFPILKDALDSLARQQDASFRLIIVDQNDKPDEQLVEYLRAYKVDHKHIRISEKGLPNARNVGAAKAKNADILIFCDDDIIASPRLVANHARNYTDPSVGGVAGRVFRKGKKPSDSKRVGRFRYIDADFTDNFDSRHRAETDSVFGCNMSFRRDALEKAGGFDKLFGGTAHLEETDASLRVKKLGLKLVFDPEAELEHVYVSTGGCRMPDMRRWVYWYAHNYTLLYMRHFCPVFLPIFLTERLIRVALFGIQETSFMVFGAGIRGVIDGMGTHFKNK